MKNIFCKSLLIIFAFNVLFQVSGKTNVAGLNGTYTVGTGGDFATIADAFSAFNAEPITGPVVFLLTDDSYTLQNITPTLNYNPGSSAANTLVVKPAAGKTVTIYMNVQSAILLNGLSYFTLEGSNNGTDSRDLTMDFFYAKGIIQVKSTSENSCNHITVKNTVFYGRSTPPSQSGIEISGPLPNDFFTAVNNKFTTFVTGIKVTGNQNNPNTGYIIRKNDFGSLEYGLSLSHLDDFQISDNNFGSLRYLGIGISGNSSNGAVYNNKIFGVAYTYFQSAGINLASSVTSSNIIVYNNFIAHIGNLFESMGICIYSGGGYKIYNNTIYKRYGSNGPSYNLYIGSGIPDNAVDLRNNILDNSVPVDGSLNDDYLIYSLSPRTVFSHIDYNLYYSNYEYGFISGSSAATFNNLKVLFGDNTHSVSAKPVYLSDADLHLPAAENSALKNLGTVLPEVTFDIDGEVRNPLAPDIGADEFSFALGTENTEKKTIKFYPNPVTDYIHLISGKKMEKMELINIAGQIITTEIINSESGKIDMRRFSPGIYLLKIQEVGDIRVIKVLKK